MRTPPNGLSIEASTPQAWAAMNNAVWCDTVCRAHGVPGGFAGSVWLTRHVPPPYHPNLVTLHGAAGAADARAQVQSLLRLNLPHRWTVKASQAELDLVPWGFEPLFDAHWIWRDPDATSTVGVGPGGWSCVRDPAGLDAWHLGWSANGADPNLAGHPPQFPASLLADPEVSFLALHDSGRLVGGAIANRTGPVVGLSNTFGPDTSGDFWTGLVGAAQAAFPALPLIGYEHGASLDAARVAGFATIGRLCVWIRHG